MKVNSARLTKENYSAGCGDACPLCGKYVPSEFTGSKPFHRSGFDQHYIGWAESSFVGRTDRVEVAAVFECEFCFAVYWFHWPKDSITQLATESKSRSNTLAALGKKEGE